PSSSNTILAGTDTGIFRSTNAGNSWTAANSGLASLEIVSLAFSRSNPVALYAGTHLGGLYKSVDGGSNWIRANQGPGPVSVTSIAIDPIDPNRMFVAGDGRPLKTSDGGVTWIILNSSPSLNTIAIDPLNPNTLYGGSISSSLYRSTDSGESWSMV